VAEISAKATVRVIEIGDDGEGRPSVTLGFDDAEILLRLATRDDCRALAAVLGDDAEVTITIAIPGGRRA
jgi:hypothetical protein